MRIITLFIAFLLLAVAYDVRAADSVSAEERLELRLRLDSLEVEKQTLKRQGKPLAELETAAAQLRDTLSVMRSYTVPLAQQQSSGKSFFLSDISFSPRGFFDWFIIAVGVIALLAGFLLVMGILRTARVNKRRNAAPKAKQNVKTVSKRMNLAPQEEYAAAAAPEIPKIVPSSASALQTPQSAFSGYDFAGRQNGQLKTETQDKKNMSGEDKTISLLRERVRRTSTPEQQTAAAPLFVNAELPVSAQSKTAPAPRSEPQSARQLVVASAQEGLTAQEISKRHQISIDQINLILRMEKKKI